MSKFYYKLAYRPYQHRSRHFEHCDGGRMNVNWKDEEVPESLTIHFYTTRTLKTKGFFGIGAKEYVEYYWKNENQLNIPRQDDEEENSWFIRVKQLAEATICDLERMEKLTQRIDRHNERLTLFEGERT